VDFAMKVINWDSNTIIRVQLWDIAGEFFDYYWSGENDLSCLLFHSQDKNGQVGMLTDLDIFGTDHQTISRHVMFLYIDWKDSCTGDKVDVSSL